MEFFKPFFRISVNHTNQFREESGLWQIKCTGQPVPEDRLVGRKKTVIYPQYVTAERLVMVISTNNHLWAVSWNWNKKIWTNGEDSKPQNKLKCLNETNNTKASSRLARINGTSSWKYRNYLQTEINYNTESWNEENIQHIGKAPGWWPSRSCSCSYTCLCNPAGLKAVPDKIGNQFEYPGHQPPFFSDVSEIFLFLYRF